MSCGSDANEDEFSGTLRDYIIGEWKLSINSTNTYTFSQDGTGMQVISQRKIPFKWILNGNNLSVKHLSDSYLDREGEVKISNVNKMMWGYLYFERTGEYNPGKPDNPSVGEDNDFAPKSLVGKIIRFNEYNANGLSTGYDNRIQFYNEHDMRANWASQSSSYTYSKTGKDTGHLNFICGQTVNYVTRVFRYDIILTFKDSEGNFELKGTKEITGAISGNGTYAITGKGSYWDKLWNR